MITLKPTFRYWLMINCTKLIILSLLFFIALFMRQTSFIMFLLGVLAIAMLLNAMWSYVVLYNITYMIDMEQIIIKRGVFRRTTDYLELYRVYDYQKRQHVIEAAFGIMTLVFLSRDLSNPIIKFVGINNDNNVIPLIRERVETQKQRKNIVEFNNPFGLVGHS